MNQDWMVWMFVMYKLYVVYIVCCKKVGVMDFDDFLYWFYELL